MLETLMALDGNILLWIQNNIRKEWLTPFVIFYTKIGGMGKVWLLLCLILLCFKQTRKMGIAGAMGIIFSLAFNNLLLKNLFARTRPYEVISGLELLVHKATDYSFPSGHAGTAFAAFGAIFFQMKKRPVRWLVFLPAVLMALSRLYIGIHYPTDVIGGAVLGLGCGFVAVQVTKLIKQ